MKNYYLLFTFILILSSCANSKISNQSKIIGSWKLPAEKEQANIIFYPDSSYTVYGNKKIDFGKWSYINENEIQFGDDRITINKVDDTNLEKKLIVSIQNDKKKTSENTTLVEIFSDLIDYKTDPFHPQNNKWRQRPTKKETDKEIKLRLANYLLHNIYVFNSAYESNANKVSFEFSRGIIKIYEGAIGVVKENRINKEWIACFYDEDDAKKAFNLYSSYLNKQGVYKVKSTGDWLKDDHDALMVIYSKILEGKSDSSNYVKS